MIKRNPPHRGHSLNGRGKIRLSVGKGWCEMSKYGHRSHNWFEAIVNKLGGESDAERFLRGELVVSERDKSKFMVIIDYSRTLDQMMADAASWLRNTCFSTADFPISGRGIVSQEVILVDFDRDVESDEVVQELAKMGLEPARIEHALAMGEKYPDTQPQLPAVFLGSVWRNHVPFRILYGNQWMLNLQTRDLKWGGKLYRFAAIRKGTTQKTFPITVDYNRTLEQMIAACACGYNNKNITAANFPISGTGVVEQEIILVDFDHDVESDEVVRELAAMEPTLEPARIEHALAFGEKYPDVQCDRPVVFLGSVWGSRVPYLSRWHDERKLSLDAGPGGWSRSCQFAAIRKISKPV